MYFMIRNKEGKLLCEVSIYTEQDTYMDCFWNITMKTYFNIENCFNYLCQFIEKKEDIIRAFSGIQNFVLDLNEHVSGDYPEFLQYELSDPAFNESKSQVIKVTRDRLYNIVNDLGDTGIYVNED